jgi:hypothetical protein
MQIPQYYSIFYASCQEKKEKIISEINGMDTEVCLTE